jgi:glycosyltransferase involved in cell wall biosynthesis
VSNNKKVLITFLGNINYDTRCKNLFESLSVNGYDVEFFGFDWLTKDFKATYGKITIHKLNKGFFSSLFYLKFSLILKLKLLSSKASIIFAEDIYTLPLVVMIGKLKGAKVYYDSRELFGYLAGLKGKKHRQAFWKWIERIFIRKVDYIIVTGKMDEDFIREKFKTDKTIIIRNLPRYYKPLIITDLRSNLQIEKSKKIILYQGTVVKGRGIQKIFDVLKELPQYVFVIVGGGEDEEYYKQIAAKMDLVDQVYFIGKYTQEELPKITFAANAGAALIENLSLSYYYALPNKLFEYIMAEVPVIVSNLPQMKEIIKTYQVGLAVDPENKDEVISALKKLSEDENLYKTFKHNCKSASEELNWEEEVVNLLQTL